MPKIIVLGAGYAGVLTAKHLAKKYKKDKSYEISIIDKNSYHTMLTELHEVAAGRVDEESIKMELSDIFAHRNVNVILDEVCSIDYEKQEIKSIDTTYEYDYLVIATGSKPTFFNVTGSEYAYQLWSYEDAVNLKEQILHAFRIAACTKDVELRKKYLSFSIIGSGFTGVEMAGELGEYKSELCRKFNINADEVSINLIDAVDHILPNYSEKLVKKVEKRLQKMGVTILCNHAVNEIEEMHVVTSKGNINSYTTIWAAGIEGSGFASTCNLKQEGRSRIATNKYLQSVDHDNVYVAGDNIFYIPEGSNAPVPQMVENAERSSKLVAHNIVAQTKKEQLSEYKPKFNGSMVSVGGRWGVAYIGSNPDKMTSMSGFFAMFIKHFINVVYFMEVLGLHKVYSYVKHEFLIVKNKRSFLGGHFSNAKNSPTTFLVPLRIFLGLMWLMSGIAKVPGVMDDWTKVTAFPNKATRLNIVVEKEADDKVVYTNDTEAAATTETAEADTTASATATTETAEADTYSAATGETTTDAATSATGEGEVEAKPEVEKSDFEVFAADMGATFELKAGKATPTFKFMDNIMNWAYQTFFWDGDTGFTTLAAVFQTGMIIAEIIVGLMFIVGLLTPIAAILSFVMMFAIYMSGWSYMAIFFYGFGGIACFSSGNSLGLDYYLLPWLNKKLRSWKLTKKWYLYFK